MTRAIHLPNLVFDLEKAFHAHSPKGNGERRRELPKRAPLGSAAKAASTSVCVAMKWSPGS